MLGSRPRPIAAVCPRGRSPCTSSTWFSTSTRRMILAGRGRTSSLAVGGRRPHVTLLAGNLNHKTLSTITSPPSRPPASPWSGSGPTTGFVEATPDGSSTFSRMRPGRRSRRSRSARGRRLCLVDAAHDWRRRIHRGSPQAGPIRVRGPRSVAGIGCRRRRTEEGSCWFGSSNTANAFSTRGPTRSSH